MAHPGGISWTPLILLQTSVSAPISPLPNWRAAGTQNVPFSAMQNMAMMGVEMEYSKEYQIPLWVLRAKIRLASHEELDDRIKSRLPQGTTLGSKTNENGRLFDRSFYVLFALSLVASLAYFVCVLVDFSNAANRSWMNVLLAVVGWVVIIFSLAFCELVFHFVWVIQTSALANRWLRKKWKDQTGEVYSEERVDLWLETCAVPALPVPVAREQFYWLRDIAKLLGAKPKYERIRDVLCATP